MANLTIGSGQRILESGSGSDFKTIGIKQSQGTSPVEGDSFADTLKKAVDGVNDIQKQSDKAMADLATGRTDNVADVMITAEKADIALRVMTQVRNKIIDAYNEIMKMQV